MKRLLLALFFAAFATSASAQCNGIFANNTVCGNITGSANLPRPTNPSAFLGAAGGTNGQIQYNNAGALDGFTMSGDVTTNTGTGVATIQNKTGNGANIATSTGSLTSGNCVSIDANGNLVDAGSVCGGGGALYILPADYGAVCDGVTDDAVALQNAINASVNKTLFIPPATCLTNSSLDIPSNVSITGAGREASIVKFGSTSGFTVVNRSNVSITNIHIQGSNAVTSWAVSSVGPIRIEQNGSSVAAGTNFTFRYLKLSDWNNTFWVWTHTSGSTFTLSNLDISDNDFVSDANSIPNDADPLNDQNYLLVLFSNTAGNGQIQNLSINRNRMETTGACYAIVNFANTYRYSISDNSILNPGATSTSHCTNGLGFTNTYGIAVYDLNEDSNPASNGIVSRNYIANPKATGIYITGNSLSTTLAGNAARMTVSDNFVIDQSTLDASSARGAIVISFTTDVSVIGNTIFSSAVCIVVSGQNIGDVSVLSNHCQSGAGGSIGIKLLSGTNGSSNTDRRVIRGNFIDVQDVAIPLTSTTSQRFNALDISGNHISGGAGGISAASQFFSSTFLVSNNSISGTSTFGGITGSHALQNNAGLSIATASLPAANNGSSVFVSDGTGGSSPCTGGSVGATAFRQNGAWKCF